MSRITDVRLRSNFYTDIKTERLIRKCGEAGVIALQKLWIYVAEHFPAEGCLLGYTTEEVAFVIGTDDKNLLAVLEEVGYITTTSEGWIEIVNWKTDQSWVIGAPERSAKARNAAKTRWGNHKPRGQLLSDDDIPI